jgi:uncharacterized iron-regulated protein
MRHTPVVFFLCKGLELRQLGRIKKECVMTRTLALAATAFLLASTASQAQTRLPVQVSIDNQRAATMTELLVSDGAGKVIARLGRPLAAGKKITLKLGKAKGCEMVVQAKFDDEGEVEETLNLCKEKVLRFRE